MVVNNTQMIQRPPNATVNLDAVYYRLMHSYDISMPKIKE